MDKLSKNTTLCGKLLKYIYIIYMKMNTNFFLFFNYVKMSSTWGQSAWFIKNFYKSSETTRSAFYSQNIFYSIFSKNTNLKDTFYKWFVGIIDGNGIFYFFKNKKGIWTFCFKVTQNKKNVRLLYHIKTMIEVGSVNITQNSIAEFLIQDSKIIIKYVLPIIDKYPLLTSKDFNYKKFREAILISENISISKKIKDNKITIIYNKVIPNNYVSSAWINITEITIYNVNIIISKEWIIGFTEVNGSFYLVKKEQYEISHMFEIKQKQDKIILDAISIILPIKVYNNKSYWICITTNKNDIYHIINYYKNTLKGIKSMEYRIWSRSFIKNLSFSELEIIGNKMKKISYTK
uniref:Homing endonuclease LAGLIDADG domain-containing protein n=1 Tax=Malassezia yamatoensis TaxID=253288 RepID=A0A2I6QD22_9BASI|nr:hypothetical protein [Malassezia yamatoensis]